MAPGKRKSAVLEDLLGVTSPKSRKTTTITVAHDPLKEEASAEAVVELLHRALHTHEDAEGGTSGGGSQAPRPRTIAIEIEDELQKKFTSQGGRSGKAYKTAVRNLSANLKRNADLAARVLNGAVLPAQLVNMDSFQLATSEQKEQLAKSHVKLLREATLHDSAGLTNSDDYTCPACQSTACSYLDMGRRDIGKSETWGGKQHEGRDRTVTCLTCGYKWAENFM